MPDSFDSRSSDAEHRFNLIALLACGLGLAALLIGGVSLLVHHVIKEPTPPYQVGFSTVGKACQEDSDSGVKGLVLDRSTGEILYCGVVPGFGGDPAGSGGAFTGDETARVTGLAMSLASEGGMSEEDEHAVERLATEIGRQHGYEPPTLAARVTGAVGPYGIGAGLVLLVGFGIVAHYLEEP